MEEIKIKLTTKIVNTEKTKWMVWTPTAIELWNDKNFLEKRYQEQLQYLRELRSRDLTRQRFDELRTSALEVGMGIVDRLRELEKVDKKEKCRCENYQDQCFCDFYACGRCDGKEIDKQSRSLIG